MRLAASAMNARVAGERCALRRVMNANVSTTGGSKVVLCRRRAKPRPSATRRGPSGARGVRIVSPRPRAARSSAASTYSTSISGSSVTPARWARSASWRRVGAFQPKGGPGGGGVPAEAGVVEDQGRLREALDRHGLAHALGVGGEVEELVVDGGLD